MTPSGPLPFLLIFKALFLILFIGVDSVSIWDPFCKEEILYMPYVRVFQKGRPGALLRDRGPGFIDISGLQDIYICTNGLVMMYYAKTRGLGEVFESGELHWAPHHCELYNPSSNNGMPGDHPKKTLLSILLIGHPQDYRRPALQMFVAPMFDVKHGDYINVTSLIMMGTDGECLIEKGPERARLRIRNARSNAAGGGGGAAEGGGDAAAAEPGKEPVEPPIFCQLDAQRKLGQKGVITLAKPGSTGMKDGGDLYEFKAKKNGFKDTPFENYANHTTHVHSHQKLESGSKISPRFKATDGKEDDPLASLADDVYAALINDNKMRFIGCLRYPDFSEEQMKVIEQKKEAVNDMDASKEQYLIKESEPPFWAEKIDAPWPESGETKTNEARYTMYAMIDVEGGEVEKYEDAMKKVEDAKAELAAKYSAKAEQPEIKAATETLAKEELLFSLWPFKKAYEVTYKHVKDLDEQVKKAWETVFEKTNEAVTDEVELSNPDDIKAVKLAHWRKIVLQKISQKKYDLRYEPYNRQLVEEYDQHVNETAVINTYLRKKSIELGPMISNAETIYSRVKVYKMLLRRTMTELEAAVRTIEKTGKAAEYVGGDPFDKFFVDTMIEISDVDGGKACYDLPSQPVACNSIKPLSARAGQLLDNVKGKGSDWPADQAWRGDLLGMIEHIFTASCPYINIDFAPTITKIIKGYLLAQPLGTGLKMPISGTRLEAHDHEYQSIVYSGTYNETHMENQTEQPTEGRLRPMDPFWSQLMAQLNVCVANNVAMEFWHNEEGDKPAYITYRKYFRNNQTEKHFEVDDLMMLEKADLEYSLNWAIEMNWRIFGTVMGACMTRFENSFPHITARFYALYSRDFLHPLRQIWMSNRDNPVLHTILGNFYNRGRGDRWAKICMESAFMEFDMRHHRPPRNLYVNAFTEMNYFITGPLAGTSGILSFVESSL